MIAKTKIIDDINFLTKNLPTMRYVDPEYVYLPLTNTRCKEGEVFVKVGDYVKIGQKIGLRKASFFEQPIHATVSGEIVGFEKKFHRSGKLIECVKIKNDKKDIYEESCRMRTPEEIKTLTKEDFVNITRDCSLVGLGGSGFPTYIKFQTADPVHTVLINGIECEPYLTSDYRLMVEFPERIMNGISYIMQAFGAKKAYIAIKNKNTVIYDILTSVKKRFKNLNVEVVKVGNYYPQGWEIEMIKTALNVEVPTGVLPSKLGFMTFNVSTVVGIYKAIKYNMPVTKRNFTVTGDGINFPQNFRLRVGTSIKDLIELCDGYVDESPKTFIMGGPMMGACIVSDNAVVSKTSTSVIILNNKKFREETCIRCASCTYSCPVNIQPVQIMNAVKNKDIAAIKRFNVNKCIECGLCSYTCTSKIHLTDFMRQAKKMIK